MGDYSMTGQADNTPSWIKRHKGQKETEQNQAELDRQRQLEASTLIRDKGPDFWQQLVEHIAINVRALKELEGEELIGTISVSDQGHECNCYFQVNRQSVKFGPELSRMNLWYLPGGSRIRRWYQDQDIGDVELVAYGDEVRALYHSSPIGAQQLAELTVESMAERVKPRGTSRYF
jgi:hypothetical protein